MLFTVRSDISFLWLRLELNDDKTCPKRFKAKTKKKGGGLLLGFAILNLPYLATTVIDLKAFLVATSRKCIAGFNCAEEKGEENFSPFPYWIRSMICPKRAGRSEI